jgi:hypothetical protein
MIKRMLLCSISFWDINCKELMRAHSVRGIEGPFLGKKKHALRIANVIVNGGYICLTEYIIINCNLFIK